MNGPGRGLVPRGPGRGSFGRLALEAGSIDQARKHFEIWVELGNVLDQAGGPAAAVRAFRQAAASVNLLAAPAAAPVPVSGQP